MSLNKRIWMRNVAWAFSVALMVFGINWVFTGFYSPRDLGGRHSGVCSKKALQDLITVIELTTRFKVPGHKVFDYANSTQAPLDDGTTILIWLHEVRCKDELSVADGDGPSFWASDPQAKAAEIKDSLVAKGWRAQVLEREPGKLYVVMTNALSSSGIAIRKYKYAMGGPPKMYKLY
jgi:hypothetical protein